MIVDDSSYLHWQQKTKKKDNIFCFFSSADVKIQLLASMFLCG